MQWLHTLPDEKQVQVIDLAVEMRQGVWKQIKDEEEQRARERRQNMVQVHTRREVLKRKAQQERNELSPLHLITTSEELCQAIVEMDTNNISGAKKTSLKHTLVSTQVKIRKEYWGRTFVSPLVI